MNNVSKRFIMRVRGQGQFYTWIHGRSTAWQGEGTHRAVGLSDSSSPSVLADRSQSFCSGMWLGERKRPASRKEYRAAFELEVENEDGKEGLPRLLYSPLTFISATRSLSGHRKY